ncbi:MAG TPA: DUF1800 domain-containing protein [Acidobacteriaceae bacterium]
MKPGCFARLRLCASVLALTPLALIGCSGGTTGGGGSTPPATTVSVTGAASTRLGASTQFTATVTNATNTAVTWQVNGTTGGSATLGIITTAGIYTAPATMPSSSTVTISAISQASPTASGTLSESLQNPLPVLTSGTATQVNYGLSYLVDVKGTGFVPTSAIQAASTAQATTFVSSTELQATVTVASGTTSLPVAVVNPNPGGSTSSSINLSLSFASISLTTAARLLDQTSFGPTADAIQHVQSVGINGYLTEQFAQPATLLAQIPTSPLPALCLANNTAYPCAESEWWQTAMTGPDQLRQRVAFALSEMFVVSTQSVPGQAIPSFHNTLANDAFGNFSTVMKDVSLSPAMGAYLNMLNSAKPATGQIANENYPRELMQLFTMGLDQLNQDGSVQTDSSGNPIPAYTQAQVQAFAKAYTGWTLANVDGSTVTKFPNNSGDYSDPMVAVATKHDTTSKILLDGTTLPAGQTAQQDLQGALTNIFNNSNVGPFVCRQLIQHLVTSNPSPAYVSRIAGVFANNGSGTRGDLKAVITAMLTDIEARAGDMNASFDGGHLREPILFITAMMRGLGFTNTDTNGSYFSLSSQSSKLSEEPYRANSVFNFFPPDYVIPDSTLNAPEFDIENTATSVLQLSLADSIVNNKINGFKVDLSSTSALGMMANNPGNLVDTLSMLFMHSQMPDNMRTAIVNAVTAITIPTSQSGAASAYAQRVRVAVYLVITSSQYKVIH